jgi:cytochrome c553
MMKKDSRKRSVSVFTVLLFAGAIAASIVLANSAQAETNPRGKALFGLCTSCHGAQGHGNVSVGAPAIAGLPGWYVQAQLEKFYSGARGQHPTDDAGNRMRPMAKMMKGDDIKIVAEYVSALPSAIPPTTLTGDIEKGKASYMVCSACHGQNAEGNEALRAPPLKISNDWYLVRQLTNFKGKVRAGDTTKDPVGSVMTGMAATLADEQAMKDVILYIHSLK